MIIAQRLDIIERSDPPPIAYRVAFVCTHPVQYVAPLFAYLSKYANIEVTALYLSDFSIRGEHDRGFGQSIKWDIDLLQGYKSQFLGSAAARRKIGGFFSMVGPQLWGAIRGGEFDAVVIHGHNLAAHHVALMAAKSTKCLTFARAETHLGLKRSAWRGLLRTPLLKMWYKLFDGFLAIGSRNSRYFAAMSIPQENIFLMPYAVDNDRFLSAAEEAHGNRQETRRRLGIEGNAPAILFAAKFDYRKRPSDLVEAFSLLQRQGVQAYLVMAGSGVLERQLKTMVADRGIRDVVFPGFINQAELPDVYAACDVFVLPSENEPWGLTVNEAMCAGLPVVASQEIGCVEDLVHDGENGATFTAGDVNGLAAALHPILVDSDFRAKCRASSLARIRNWSYRECAIGLRKALEAKLP
ncbi:glycosyltransferase family 4 protein [Mesorhizobium sp. M1273]|uniref:glycosyltransferase family 4 protein n=1 Tax=Mesorhizobium sp. M1273 TaxID=2957075 RepID=UPI00333618FF